MKALRDVGGPLPPKPVKAKKTKHRKRRGAKPKAVTGSDSSDSTDDNVCKSPGGQGVKSSSKAKPQSSEKELNTIVTDSTFLMPEIVMSGQTEHDECHHADISGFKDIQKTDVSSNPNDTTKFGLSQVQTQLSEYIESTLSLLDIINIYPD